MSAFADVEIGALLDSVRRLELTSFVEGAIDVLAPGSAFLSNYHVAAIAYSLERVLNGESKRLLITVPPRHLKSITASVCFPAWALGCNPQARIVCVSHTAD